MTIRAVKRVSQSRPTLEGAGVKLRRAFGFGDTSDFDPFLMMDDFRNDRPSDYLAGFPWHPHRGIETITYVLAGSVAHGDSLGNSGVLGAGDVQWMTAGRGILHQEMPKGDAVGRMHGFQLWANLPSNLKMTAPRYQDVPSVAIPEVVDDDGVSVRVICGEFWGQRVRSTASPQTRAISTSTSAEQAQGPAGRDYRQAFAYIFEGSASFAGASQPFGALREELVGGAEVLVRDAVGDRSLVVFDSGDEVVVQAGEQGVRFLVSGKPLREPIAWHGPIVMNTQAEIRQALTDLRDGSFIVTDWPTRTRRYQRVRVKRENTPRGDRGGARGGKEGGRAPA